jgi:hypothetical protein
MANTGTIDKAARAAAGHEPGGNGRAGSTGRFGLGAKLAAGVALLGCAAALILGGVRAGHAAQTRARVVPPATALPAGTDDLATNGCIGSVGPFACASTPRANPYGVDPEDAPLDGERALHVWNAMGDALPDPFTQRSVAPAVTGERLRFLEWNTQLPSQGAPALAPPGPANFQGEDH